MMERATFVTNESAVVGGDERSGAMLSCNSHGGPQSTKPSEARNRPKAHSPLFEILHSGLNQKRIQAQTMGSAQTPKVFLIAGNNRSRSQ